MFEGHRQVQRRHEPTRQMQPPDDTSATHSRSLATELGRRIDAAHAALQSWPSAFATGDVENVRRTLPAVTALCSFLEDHGSEAIAGIGSVVLDLWGGIDCYAAAGRGFIAGDVVSARANWDSGNAAWAKASVVAPT